MAERCRDFSTDRGPDSGQTNELLWDDYRIRPLIDTRELWREERQAPDYDPTKPVTRSLDPERVDTIVHTEKGTVHCFCPATGEQRDLASQGFEADRDTLQIPLPRRRLRFGMRRIGPMPPSRRCQLRRLRAHFPHQNHRAGPAHLRAHPPRQSLLVSRLGTWKILTYTLMLR